MEHISKYRIHAIIGRSFYNRTDRMTRTSYSELKLIQHNSIKHVATHQTCDKLYKIKNYYKEHVKASSAKTQTPVK